MPTRWDVERAVKASDLPAMSRLLMLDLLTLVDIDTAVIPEQFTPSLTALAKQTGLGRSTVARELNVLEDAGWVRRDRPTVADARAKHARTGYSLHVGASPTAGLVPEGDQPASPAPGPELVPQRDQTPPKLVPQRDTTRPTTSRPTTKPKTSGVVTDPPPPRLDAERICTALADAIEANGSKRPTITAKWRTEARLLLDRDGRTVDQVLAAITWCQNDPFWRGNVLSMPTLRKQYDRLRLAASRDRPTTQAATGTGPPPSRNAQILAAAMERARAAERNAP